MLPIKLFRLVFCLLWFNRNIKLSETNETKVLFQKTGYSVYGLIQVKSFFIWIALPSTQRRYFYWYSDWMSRITWKLLCCCKLANRCPELGPSVAQGDSPALNLLRYLINRYNPCDNTLPPVMAGGVSLRLSTSRGSKETIKNSSANLASII
jgi:hypothetical protein